MNTKNIPKIRLGSYTDSLNAYVSAMYSVYISDNDEKENFYDEIKNNFIDIRKENIKNKTFYRNPDINIHRDKLNNLKDKFNISIKRDAEKADYIIINPINLKKCNIINCKAYYKEDVIKNNFFNSEDLKNIITSCSSEIVFIYLSGYNNNIKILSNIKSINKAFYDVSYLKFNPNYLSQKNLISSLDLEQICTEDNKILNIEDYYFLIKMLKNKNDCDLALEILANCNYEKSKHIIYCIFFLYENIIKQNTTSYNLINIKSLRNKIQEFSIRPHYSYYAGLALAKGLQKNNILHQEAIEIVKKLIQEEIYKNFDHDIITVENFSFKIYGQ